MNAKIEEIYERFDRGSDTLQDIQYLFNYIQDLELKILKNNEEYERLKATHDYLLHKQCEYVIDNFIALLYTNDPTVLDTLEKLKQKIKEFES